MSEVEEVFAKLDTTPAAVKVGLRSFESEVSSAPIPTSLSNENFIKSGVELMLQSAEKHTALCVNEDGGFALCDTDYVTISHVWIEGVGADLSNRGLPHRLIQSIFAQVRTMGVKWIWLDSLAIPGGEGELTFLEEEIKANLINCLADVYSKAKAVVILDALVLRLRSTDFVECAVILSCGCELTTSNHGMTNTS
jgi:hypothetical protein